MPRNVPLVFGKLLYGSKFGVRCQSRGQQGIGVSAVVLISQIKTGEHAFVRTSTNGRQAHVFELSVDIDRNTAQGAQYQHRESGRLARHRNIRHPGSPVFVAHHGVHRADGRDQSAPVSAL